MERNDGERQMPDDSEAADDGADSRDLLAIVPVSDDYQETVRRFFRALFGDDIEFAELPDPPAQR